MQKLVYLSNSRDYNEQGNINENKYFTQVNKLLEEGWKVAYMTHNVLEPDHSTETQHPLRKETYMSFILLERDEEKKGPEDPENETR